MEIQPVNKLDTNTYQMFDMRGYAGLYKYADGDEVRVEIREDGLYAMIPNHEQPWLGSTETKLEFESFEIALREPYIKIARFSNGFAFYFDEDQNVPYGVMTPNSADLAMKI